jgi:hypothetical protein
LLDNYRWSSAILGTTHLKTLVLHFHEYLTDETMRSLETGCYEIELAALSLNISKNHKEIVERITELYWFEEIENYINITESEDLPESGKLKILSH